MVCQHFQTTLFVTPETESTSLTVKIVALTGGVGGILGLIIVSQSVMIVILLCMLKKKIDGSKYGYYSSKMVHSHSIPSLFVVRVNAGVNLLLMIKW